MNKLTFLLIFTLASFSLCKSNSITLNENFTLSIRKVDDKIQLTAILKTPGWIGFGLNDSMYDTDMMVVQRKPDNTFVVMDLWSTGRSTPKLDTTFEGGKRDILSEKMLLNGNEASITWERLLITGDKYDKDIVPGTMNIIVAWLKGNEFRYHGKSEDGGRKYYQLVFKNDELYFEEQS